MHQSFFSSSPVQSAGKLFGPLEVDPPPRPEMRGGGGFGSGLGGLTLTGVFLRPRGEGTPKDRAAQKIGLSKGISQKKFGTWRRDPYKSVAEKR